MESTARRTSRARRVALCIVTIFLASMPATIMAADGTPTSTPDQQSFVPFSPDVPVDTSRIWIVLLIFLTALAIAAIVAYVMRNENRDTRNWVTALLAAGHAVSTDQVAAVLHAEPTVRGGEEDENAPSPPVTVLGPTTIARGAEALYRAVDETGKPITEEDVTWLIVDGNIIAGDVTLQAPSGPFTVLSTQKLGIFILQVTAGERTPANIPITVVESVAEPKQSGLKAFFLGEGYGTINLALFLMAIVAALGAIGVVGDGTVSTIFGAMAGYIFGIAVVTHNKGGGSGSDSGG